MKKRIVLWGTCANDEKCLLALELRDKENKVNLYTFPESIATEIFYNQLMNLWREGNDLPFPEGYKLVERDLAITEDLLPEDIKVDRPDVIVRAKAEWHFVVLSAKLYEIYNSELEDLKEKVDQLKEYDDNIWEEMKVFWVKVQEQSIEKNIFRGHANALKEKTNKIFDRLKDLKKILDQRFREESRERASEFKKKLEAIEAKIEQGLGLKPIFEELKKMQGEFHGTPFTRKDRRKTWEYLDGLFKKVKAKRFGDKKGGSKSGVDRVSRRYDGLISAIAKMERSIQRDRQEQDFQNKRISQTDGQLEMQIRQAKLIMIEGRVKSKEEKLEDMYKTKVDLEARMAKIKEKEEQRKTQEKVKAAKEEIKEKIADTLTGKSADIGEDAENLKKAAEEINESKKRPPKKETLLSAITETVGESLEDVVDTVRAVADVVGDKIEDATENLKEKVADAKEESTSEKAEESKDSSKDGDDGDQEEKKKASAFESISDTISESMEDMVDKVKAVADKVADKIEDATENLKEKVADAKEESTSEKTTESKEAKGNENDSQNKEKEEPSAFDSLVDSVSESIDDVVDKAKVVADVVSDKIEEATEKLKERASKAKESAPQGEPENKASSKEEGNGEKENGGSILGSVVDVVSDSLEDVTETIKSVAGTMGEKIDEAIDNITKEEEE